MSRVTGYSADCDASVVGAAQGRPAVAPTWVRSYDYALLATLATAAAVWWATGIPVWPIRPWIWAHLGYVSSCVAGGFIILASLRFVAAARRRSGLSTRRARVVYRRHFGLARLARVGRYLAALCVVMTVHTTLKQAIPFINAGQFDAELRVLERWVHFGMDPAWALAGSPAPEWWLMVLDTSYYLWFPACSLVAAYFLTHRDRRKGDHYLTAFLGIWMVGVLVGLAVPSHGPCYVDPGRFSASALPFCAVTQNWLGERYATLNEIGPWGDGGMTFGCGLMAMPSLHVAVCVLYAVFFWSEARWMRWASIGYAVLVFLGSLYSGWHYAVDGYAGAALALGVILVARRLPHHYAAPSSRGRHDMS